MRAKQGQCKIGAVHQRIYDSKPKSQDPRAGDHFNVREIDKAIVQTRRYRVLLFGDFAYRLETALGFLS